MRDPHEGRSATGMIITGVRLDRIAPAFWPIVEAAAEACGAGGTGVALYIYGSLATGQAVVGASDVDLLAIDLEHATSIGSDLSERFSGHCRGVEIGMMSSGDLAGESDEAYGNRVFLRHYCVYVAGPDHHRPAHDFPADARAARGFNGDIGVHAQRWREALDGGDDPRPLAARVARKTLLAVAGLVSVHDGIWTTDRSTAAIRWSEIDPRLRTGLATLSTWSSDTSGARLDDVDVALDGVVARVVERFATVVGRWELS
jgi:hypothetical protein